MQAIVTILTLYMFQKSNSLTIDGGSNDPDAVVEVYWDSWYNRLNKVTAYDEWKVVAGTGITVYDWKLAMTLDAHEFGFQNGEESTLSITMDGYKGSTELDVFYAFRVGNQYFTFAMDFDSGLYVHDSSVKGIFIYPSRGSNSFPTLTGDALRLIDEADTDDLWEALRTRLAGDNTANWHRLTPTPNADNFPVTFEFINDDIADTFTFRFISDSFPSGLECVYNSAMATDEDFQFYLTPDSDDEILYIKSFSVSGENVGNHCDVCDDSAVISSATECNSVTINGGITDADIVVELTDDTRGINEICKCDVDSDSNDYWKLSQPSDNPLYDWGLSMTLDAETYSFQSGEESKLSITMDGYRGTGQSDGFYAFSVGNEYFTFAHDFDGTLGVGNGDGYGIFIYPSCGASSFASGDASQLITQSSTEALTHVLRDGLAGGDRSNWYTLTSSRNYDNFPVTFEFINDDISNTFTFRFISDSFPSGLECAYDTAMATGEDFKFYFSNDGDNEISYIKSFDVSGESLGTECGSFCIGAASAYGIPSNEMKFVPDNEHWNKYDYDYEEPLDVTTIIWSGAISSILTVMTVCISHLLCMNPKTQVYAKVNMDTDCASS